MTKHARLGLSLCAAFQVAVVVAMIGKKQSVIYYGKTIVLRSQPVDPHSLFQGDYARLRFDIHSVPAPTWNPWPPKKGETLYTELAPAATSWQLVSVSPSYPAAMPPDHVALRGHVLFTNRSSGQEVFDLVDVSSPGWLSSQPADAPWRRRGTPLADSNGLWHFGAQLAEGATVYIHMDSYDGTHWNALEMDVSSAHFRLGSPTNHVVIAGRAGPWLQKPVINAEYGIESYYIPEGQGREFERAGLDVEVAVNSRGEAVIKRVLSRER